VAEERVESKLVDLIHDARAGLLPPARVGSIAPASLLEAEFGDASSSEIARELDAWLKHLACEEARHELRIGRMLEAFVRRGGVEQFGHARRKDFAPGRLGFSWGHALELIKVASALASLPFLEAALLSGVLTRPKVRLLVDVATPEDERGWIELARYRSYRAVEQIVRATKRANREAEPCVDGAGGRGVARDPAETEEHERFVRVVIEATPDDAAAWHWGRAAGRTILGADVPDWQIVEAMAAEALTRHGGDEDYDTSDPDSAASRVRRQHPPRRALSPADLAAFAREAETRGGETAPACDASPFDDLPDLEAIPLVELHRLVMAEIVEVRGISFERSRLLSWIDGRFLHAHLGALSLMDYACCSLGLSPRETRELLDLHLATAHLPALVGAWREGRLPMPLVATLARVMPPGAEGAWLERASIAPPKRLLVECDLHFALTAQLPRDVYFEMTGGVPLDLPFIDQLLDWQTYLGVRDAEEAEAERQRRRRRGKQAPVVVPDESDAMDLDADAPDLIAESMRRRRIELRMPVSVASLLEHALHAVMEVRGVSRGRAFFLIQAEFAHEHAAIERSSKGAVARHAVFTRDGFQCRMPHCCARQGLEAHHLHYRSKGGSDDPGNLVSACHGDHALTHRGHMLVTGTSEALRVTIPATGETYVDGLLVRAA
jgi:hypothetical protein